MRACVCLRGLQSMDAVPDPKPFLPRGLPCDAVASKSRNELCCDVFPDRPDPDSVLFALHTVDIRVAYPDVIQFSGRGSGAEACRPDIFNASMMEHVLIAEEECLKKRYAGHVAEMKARRDAGMRVHPVPKLTMAYITGALPNGKKVGLVTPYAPTFEVELPEGLMKDSELELWFRSKIVNELCNAAGVDAIYVTAHVHFAARFKGYIPDPRNPRMRREFAFAKMSFPNIDIMRKCAQKLRGGVRVWSRNSGDDVSTYSTRIFPVYEDGINVDDKFIDAFTLTPSGWHVVTGATRRTGADRELLVDEEYYVPKASSIRCLTEVDPVTGIAPSDSYRVSVASLDCEMNSEKADLFPQSSAHKVVVIGIVFAFAGAVTPPFQNYVEYERHAFVLCDTPPSAIEGVIVHTFTDEAVMLAAVRNELFVRKRIDVLLGHNIVTFDVKYMAERATAAATACGGVGPGRLFLRFGALLLDSLELHMKPLVSQGSGCNKLWLLNGAGFVYVDTYLLSKTSAAKLSENSLKYVSRHYLQEDEEYVNSDGVTATRRVPMSKFDMPYNLIPVAAAGGPDDWRKLVAYCVQDCILPLRLLAKWDAITDLIAQSRVITIPMATNVKVGQQQRVRNTLMRKAHACGMVLNGVNEYTPRDWGAYGASKSGTVSAAPVSAPVVSAEGGCVLESRVGLHALPIVVLDFTSLYPSVQRAENLCWSTVIEDPKMVVPAGLEVKTYVTKTGVFRFVQNVPGVFPQQLTDLLAVRQSAKDDMKAAPKGSEKWAQANSKQLATKIVMNSGYGTANAQRGIMPCLAVGTTTCFVGRGLNEEAERFCRETYGTVTYYGDTDSIMVYFPENKALLASSEKTRLQHSWHMGMTAQRALNAYFAAKYPSGCVKTECEKVFYPVLLAGAKTYVGLKFEEADIDKATERLERPDVDAGTGAGVIEMKGIQPVRRDVPAFLRRMATEALDALLFDRTPELPNVAVDGTDASGSGALKFDRSNIKPRGNVAFWDIIHTYVEAICQRRLPLSDYIITQELKEGYDKQALVRPHVAVSYAREWSVPNSGFEEGERVPYVMVTQADQRRLRRPPSLRHNTACVTARAGFDDNDIECDANANANGGTGGVSCSPTAGAYARHVDEVIAAPDDNTIDIEYYIERGVCSLLRQLFPDLKSAQATILRYAKSAAATWARHEAAGPLRVFKNATGLGRFITIGGPDDETTDGASAGPRTVAHILAAIKAIRPALTHQPPSAFVTKALDGAAVLYDGSGDKAKVKKRKVRVFDNTSKTKDTDAFQSTTSARKSLAGPQLRGLDAFFFKKGKTETTAESASVSASDSASAQ